MVEIAALIVGALGLVLQGLSARQVKVKDDQDAVRGLVGMFDRLLVWEAAAYRTNHRLRTGVGEILVAADDQERERALSRAEGALIPDTWSQLSAIDEVEQDSGHGYPLSDAVHLLRVYAPESADTLERVFLERRAFVRDLADSLRTRYVGEGEEGLRELLDEAAKSEELLRRATEMLRVFLRETVPVEKFAGADASWVKERL